MIYTDYIESVQIGSNGTWNFDPPLRVGVEIPDRPIQHRPDPGVNCVCDDCFTLDFDEIVANLRRVNHSPV